MPPKHNMILSAAQKFLSNGISVIPLNYRNKTPHASLLYRAIGIPSWSPFTKELPTTSMLRNWFRMPAVNLGVMMSFGIGVLDFDDSAAFSRWHFGHGKKLNLPYAKTSRGVHVYFSHGEQDPQSTKVLDDSNQNVGDLKMTGYVVAPPSIHQSGSQYIWASLAPRRMAQIRAITYSPTDILGSYHKMESSPLLGGLEPIIVKSSPWQIDITPIGSLIQFENQRGDYAHALCPFHDDSNASFWINVKKNTWGCWTCGYQHQDVATLKALLSQIESSRIPGNLLSSTRLE